MTTPTNAPLATLTEYELRHLATHLATAGRDEDLHGLLALETNQGRNAWYEAKEAVGDIQGYLTDVALAWELAETARDIPRQIQYALCRSSVATLATNCPPKLLILAVKNQVLSVQHALALVEQMQNEEHRIETWLGLAAYLPEQLLNHVLALVQAMRNPQKREALARLAQRLPEALQKEILQEFLKLTTPSETLINLAPHLPGSLLIEALTLVQSLENEEMKAEALIGLVPHLPKVEREKVLNDALAASRSIKNAMVRTSSLKSLAQYLPEPVHTEVLQEALEAAQSIKDRATRLLMLKELAPSLPEVFGGAALIPPWPAVVQIKSPSAALVAVRLIEDDEKRAQMLTDLTLQLPEGWPIIALEALAAAKRVDDEIKYSRMYGGGLSTLHLVDRFGTAEVLTELAPCLPGELLITSVQSIEDPEKRARTLHYLIPYLPVTLQEEAMQNVLLAAQVVEHETNRIKVLLDLIPGLPTTLQKKALLDALLAAEMIRDGEARLILLIGLAPHLPKTLFSEISRYILQATQVIFSSWAQEGILELIAPYLSDDLLPEALVTVRTVGFEPARAAALTSLAPYLSEELWLEAINIVGTIEEENIKDRAVTDLFSHLPQSLQIEKSILLNKAQRVQKVQEVLEAQLRTKPEPSSVKRVEDSSTKSLPNPASHQAPTLQSTEAFQKVLTTKVRYIEKQWPETKIPNGLISHLIDTISSVLPKTASAFRGDKNKRKNPVKKLATLATRLSTWSDSQPNAAYPVWTTTLHQLSNYPRPVFLYLLRDLTPFPLALIGNKQKAAIRIFHVIQTVIRWWP